MEKKHKSQARQILYYLCEGNELSPLDALKLFGCFRLGARICDLRDEGYIIETKMVVSQVNGVPKRYAVYSIPEKYRKEYEGNQV